MPKKVEREEYTGPVVDLTKDFDAVDLSKLSPSAAQNGAFHHRGPTRSGGRNMQDSSFRFELLLNAYSVQTIFDLLINGNFLI